MKAMATALERSGDPSSARMRREGEDFLPGLLESVSIILPGSGHASWGVDLLQCPAGLLLLLAASQAACRWPVGVSIEVR